MSSHSETAFVCDGPQSSYNVPFTAIKAAVLNLFVSKTPIVFINIQDIRLLSQFEKKILILTVKLFIYYKNGQILRNIFVCSFF